MGSGNHHEAKELELHSVADSCNRHARRSPVYGDKRFLDENANISNAITQRVTLLHPNRSHRSLKSPIQELPMLQRIRKAQILVLDRVFGIVELLENIVQRLPPRTIILSRRVNRQFKDTIDGSIAIKKAAFLLPDRIKTADARFKINPLFVARGLLYEPPKRFSTSNYSFDIRRLYRTTQPKDQFRPELGRIEGVKLFIDNLRPRSHAGKFNEVGKNVVLRQPSGLVIVSLNGIERSVTAMTMEEAIEEYVWESKPDWWKRENRMLSQVSCVIQFGQLGRQW